MQKKYIIDTNVLIDNPNSIEILRNGEENEIYLPLYTIIELDHLKTDKNIGGSVRECIQKIIDFKDVIKIIYDEKSLKEFETQFDGKILNLIRSKNINDNILVSNDKLMRLLSEKLYRINCEEFNESNPYLTDSEYYTGIYPDNTNENMLLNSFYWDSGKIYYNKPSGPKLINYDNVIWSIKPKNIYQNLAFELLMDQDVDLVTIQSQAGFGKTLIALAAAFHLCFKEKSHKKIIITKTNHEVDKEIGFLPGNLDEKFQPIIRPIIDLIFKLHDLKPANRLFLEKNENNVFDKKRIELLPLNFIQGMNIEDCVLIIDEGQNLNRKTMRAIATRCGEKTKLIVIGDTRQVINPFINEFNNGLNWLVKLCKGEPNYGHIVLKGKHSRGPVTDLILKSRL